MPVSAGGRLSYQRKSISHDARNLAVKPCFSWAYINGTMPDRPNLADERFGPVWRVGW